METAMEEDTDSVLALLTSLSGPEDVATLIAFLASDDVRRIPGTIVLADSGQMLT